MLKQAHLESFLLAGTRPYLCGTQGLDSENLFLGTIVWVPAVQKAAAQGIGHGFYVIGSTLDLHSVPFFFFLTSGFLFNHWNLSDTGTAIRKLSS